MNEYRKKLWLIIFLIILGTALCGCRTQSTMSVAFNKKTGGVDVDAVNAAKGSGGMLDLTLGSNGKIVVDCTLKRGTIRVRVSAPDREPLIDQPFSGIGTWEYPADPGNYAVFVEVEKGATGDLSVKPVIWQDL